MDLGLSSFENFAVTIGSDGKLRLWDYVHKVERYCASFPGRGTCLEFLPFNKHNQGRVVLAGFSTGIVRWLLLEESGFRLLRALKVHSSSVKYIKATGDGMKLAVVSSSGEVFFMDHFPGDLQKLEPYCLY